MPELQNTSIPRILKSILCSTMIFGVGLLSSCNYSNSKAPSLPSTLQQGPAKAGLGFNEIKRQILEPKCVSCHFSYREYDAVKRDLGRIIEEVQTGRMPKREQPLTPDLQSLLSEWAATGAPRDVEAPPQDPDPNETLVANWKSISNGILFPKCVLCHNPNGEAKFLDLSTRQEIFNQRERDFFGQTLLDIKNPEQSYLIAVIEDEAEPMPPTSSGMGRLSPEEIEILKEWIRLGLP